MKNKCIYIFISICIVIVGCNKQSDSKMLDDKEIQSTYKSKGYNLYIKHACNTCHSLDGSRMNGPTFKNLYGKRVQFHNDNSIIADEEYLINSIINPGKEIVKGYPNLMPSYSLTKDELDSLIDFIKKY